MQLLEQLQRHAQANGDATVTDAGTMGYARLLEVALAGAGYLGQRGITAESSVGVTIADEPGHLVATLSLLLLGARQITLPTHDQVPLRAEVAERVHATHLLCENPEPRLPQQSVAWNLADIESAPVPHDLPGAGEGRLLLKTSGTTGTVNLVEYTAGQLADQSWRHPEYAHERLLRLASIEHNNSKRHRLYCLWNGGTNVFRPRAGADMLDFIERHRVTCLDISRMHASDLAATAGASRLAGIKLRTGGSAIPYAVRKEIEDKVTRQLYVRYAATECGAISMAGPGEHDAEEASGRILPGVQLEIIDAAGKRLSDGVSGEIRIRAPGMATRYFDNDEQTAKRFKDGWLHPGDMGRIRADGQLLVEGRADDMIIMNGLNIFPAEIERVLQQHPAVATAAAFPVESRVHGQIPAAAVELRHGMTATPHELVMFSRDMLALRTPRKVLIVDALPRNPQGKVLKRELVAMMKGEQK